MASSDSDASSPDLESTLGDSPVAGPAPTSPDAAPSYAIPARGLAAVEVPAVVNNIDRAVKAFGRVPSLRLVCLRVPILLTRLGLGWVANFILRLSTRYGSPYPYISPPKTRSASPSCHTTPNRTMLFSESLFPNAPAGRGRGEQMSLGRATSKCKTLSRTRRTQKRSAPSLAKTTQES